MTYSRLRWNHSSPTEPVEILSEYDPSGWECRKLEIFPDGSIGCADSQESVGGTQLSLIPRPPDQEVNSEPEFQVEDLTRDEFESAWSLRRDEVDPNDYSALPRMAGRISHPTNQNGA